jgi:hypothetical protein
MKPPRIAVQLFALAWPVLLLVGPMPAAGDALPREDGPVSPVVPPQPAGPGWKELDVSLPAYPRAGHLLELDVNVPGFRVCIDPGSLTAGKDKVVRYTSVLISGSGVWNVTYEGMHCGAKRYRRFAYGSGGEWHAIPASDWQPLRTSGSGAYRERLYMRYLCNPVEPYSGPDVILRRIRASLQRIGD